RDAYERIFTRLGLEYVIVAADAGAMGGSKSEEFLLPIAVGEDTFVRSAGGYAANVEAYTVPQAEESDPSRHPAAAIVDTPNAGTIDSIVSFMNENVPHPDGRQWNAADTLKNVIVAVTDTHGDREIVAIGVPGDREVDEKRLEVAFPNCEVEPATPED